MTWRAVAAASCASGGAVLALPGLLAAVVAVHDPGLLEQFASRARDAPEARSPEIVAAASIYVLAASHAYLHGLSRGDTSLDVVP